MKAYSDYQKLLTEAAEKKANRLKKERKMQTEKLRHEEEPEQRGNK